MRKAFTLTLAFAAALAIGAADAQAASKSKKRAPQSQSLQTQDVSATSSWAVSRQQVYRDIERYDSAPLISGGGY